MRTAYRSVWNGSVCVLFHSYLTNRGMYEMTIQQAKEILQGMLKLCYPDSLEGAARAERDHEAIAIALDCMSYCERIENFERERRKPDDGIRV